jgi:23S rRNA (adenine2030-N6)-methyltransferase
MNYRHAYHAGGFADVVKHAVLARIVEYLKEKQKAFRVIDTHAGAGLYDLASEEAQKTREWQSGIGCVLDAKLQPEAAVLLAPYLDAVRACNPHGALASYPGSPLIVRHLLRKRIGCRPSSFIRKTRTS